MGTKIQVAIQGGGAKIIGLVAAMEVLQKMEAAGEVEITRLAGTSAGAIVAALYSAKIDMGQLRLSLGTGELRELFENYEKPGKIEIIKRLVEGTPICDPGPIREFLRKLLEHAEKTYVNDLNPKVRIVSANVAKSSKHDHKDEDKLLEALMSTSALPFVFRVWDTRRQPEPPRSRWKKFYHKYIATPPHPEEKAEALRDNDAEKPWLVDGGICENLPISELLAGEHQLGPVVAITFSTDKYFRPADILGFGKAVLDTAIDNSVHRARSLLPPSAIFEIGPWFPISTLDFGEAIKAAGDVTGPGKAYKRVTDEAVKFFKRYIQRQRDGNPATSYDPWRSDNTTVRKILEANW
ncbi:MAG: patatin-like phospholipase family protein, partial [Verrucomicrobia bacterium]|nr:patatin-like phospholipase family protein [Verrucomicrobiota bacterium]